MLFMVAAMAAEMERELIQERTLDGLAFDRTGLLYDVKLTRDNSASGRTCFPRTR
jgi:hypothetical protein